MNLWEVKIVIFLPVGEGRMGSRRNLLFVVLYHLLHIFANYSSVKIEMKLFTTLGPISGV